MTQTYSQRKQVRNLQQIQNMNWKRTLSAIEREREEKKLYRQFNQWQLIKIDLLNMQREQQLAIMIH